MAGTIIVDRIESDASYASSINVAAQVTFSNTVNFGVSSVAPTAGVYSPSTNNLAFTTASTERMRITSAGNIGIGTTSPSTYGKFVVAGGDGNTQFNVGTNGVLRVAGYNSTFSGALLESVNTTQSAYLPITISGSYAVVATGGTERMRIDSSGRVTMPYQPFFYATLTVAQTGYNSSSTVDVVVIYNNAITNTGSHYNTSTGKFTAPVAGNYIFYASAYASGSSFQQNWLVVNGSRITGTDWVHASSTMSIGFWLIKLAANDTVGFHAYNGAVTSTTININSEHTYFRGYLLG